MEDIELINLWKDYDRKIEESRILNLQSWVVNLKTFEYLQAHKAKTRLHSLSSFKTRAVILGIVWNLFLGVLLAGNHFKNIYFSVSLTMLLLFGILAVAGYIRQIVLIREIAYDESITAVQAKLSELQASTIHIIRLLWLQMPFYTTWFWNEEWISQHTSNFLLTGVPGTIFFTLLALWLYRNISYKNVHKKWFGLLLGKDWTSVKKAVDYLEEIGEFKRGA